ncbi:MAG: hypothetical protein WB853_11240, partial [Desulfobacterales bacterium]
MDYLLKRVETLPSNMVRSFKTLFSIKGAHHDTCLSHRGAEQRRRIQRERPLKGDAVDLYSRIW